MFKRLFRVVTSRWVLVGCLVISEGARRYNDWVNYDPQGESNFFCIREEFPAVAGGDRHVVTAHRTDCDVIAKDSLTYIYLHYAEVSDRARNLIFRYDGGDPEIVWKGPGEISITVDGASYIDKQVANLGGIKIDYTILH